MKLFFPSCLELVIGLHELIYGGGKTIDLHAQTNAGRDSEVRGAVTKKESCFLLAAIISTEDVGWLHMLFNSSLLKCYLGQLRSHSNTRFISSLYFDVSIIIF